MVARADIVRLRTFRIDGIVLIAFCRGQLFAKDEIKKLLKEIDQDQQFWIKQRPKFESIFNEVMFRLGCI